MSLCTLLYSKGLLDFIVYFRNTLVLEIKLNYDDKRDAFVTFTVYLHRPQFRKKKKT